MTKSGAERAQEFKPGIQGLRGIAMVAVLIFHIWPATLSGGFVGLDAFFVLSGYLITGGFLRELTRDGRISLYRFYARRIMRLLPTASVTMLVVVALTAWLPALPDRHTASQIAAGALYVLNWVFTAQPINYLIGIPEPVRHFWSLSVEEQYYLVWPLVLMVTWAMARRLGIKPIRACMVMVILLIAVSLAWSAWMVPRQHAVAYFSTTARAWEILVGGLLALLPVWRNRSRALSHSLAVLGTLLIVVPAYCLTIGSAYPGLAAMPPVIGALLIVLVSGHQDQISPPRWLTTRFLQYMGEVSYSLYLWHWPILVVYALYRPVQGRLWDGLAVFVLSCLVAHASKTLIEDPLRFARFARVATWRPFAIGAVFMAATLLAAWSIY
ncbi:MAG TPA: acyltransferase [Pseudoxanthomonas sp.]